MVYLVVVCWMVNKWTQEDRAGSQGGGAGAAYLNRTGDLARDNFAERAPIGLAAAAKLNGPHARSPYRLHESSNNFATLQTP